MCVYVVGGVVGSMCGVCVDVQLATMCGCWRMGVWGR